MLSLFLWRRISKFIILKVEKNMILVIIFFKCLKDQKTKISKPKNQAGVNTERREISIFIKYHTNEYHWANPIPPKVGYFGRLTWKSYRWYTPDRKKSSVTTTTSYAKLGWIGSHQFKTQLVKLFLLRHLKTFKIW